MASSSALSLSGSSSPKSSVTSQRPRDRRRRRLAWCDDGGFSSASEDSSRCSFSRSRDRSAKFHFVPRNGWHPFLKRMGCSARNTMAWHGGDAPVPTPPNGDCWLLPTSDEMALCIAQRQAQLLSAGWKLLTCSPGTVYRLSNKSNLHRHADNLGLLSTLPQHYNSPDEAEYPCILKAAVGQHGKNVYIVHAPEEVRKWTSGAFGPGWLLQELISGTLEYSTSLLVSDGVILDAICTEYEYARPEYVWPHVDEVRRSSHRSVPKAHLDAMQAFLQDYSGICNFNYKVRASSGALCIFEVNTRVGADLACDVPRPLARALFERLDALGRLDGKSKEEQSVKVVPDDEDTCRSRRHDVSIKMFLESSCPEPATAHELASFAPHRAGLLAAGA